MSEQNMYRLHMPRLPQSYDIEITSEKKSNPTSDNNLSKSGTFCQTSFKDVPKLKFAELKRYMCKQPVIRAPIRRVEFNGETINSN